ncbi:Abi family protein [Mammaliicoccus sciuri]|uniref:Abi family protein n=1 Tax=Mammaliicoccus sciuri TaxID=1296 RepID=UPI001FB480A6|nr:Abi family protein [Mammaliicoccus sciuri]MCJ1785235.1 Abi family protein [Mammaliicoccus sciuri]MDC5694330.1 Abi family protein [Mammaliicoccus sciuri]
MIESKTYHELVEILKNEKGIDIIEVEYCVNLLKQYGYFNLINNYKKDISIILKDEKPTINDIVYLKELDNDLQSLIFKFLIQIETTFKSHLSYFLANEFGPSESDYTNKYNYKSHIRAKKIFDKIKSKPHINFNKYPAKHYKKNYQDIPPWVYLKHIPLGDTINIFSELKTNHKEKIINDWIQLNSFNTEEKIDFITQLLKYCQDFRNSIAHGGRLLNYVTKKEVTFTHFKKTMTINIINSKEAKQLNGSFFYLLISMIILLPNYRKREFFVQEILLLEDMYLSLTENYFIQMFHAVSKLPDNYSLRLLEAAKWSGTK